MWCIGPPLRDSFVKLMNTSDPETIEMALAYFRDRYATIGLFESVSYPGVDEMLKRLQDAECRLFVVTSNATLYTKEIMAHFSLAKYFDQVYGPTLDGVRDDKVDLIKFVLSENKLDPATTLMVGDRLYDINAAHKNKIAGLGVTYGYGSVTELTRAGAIALCDSESAIATWILGAKVLL